MATPGDQIQISKVLSRKFQHIQLLIDQTLTLEIELFAFS